MRQTRKKFKTQVNTSKRINFLIALFLIATGTLLARLYHLQIVKGEDYSAFAKGIYFKINNTQPPRGDIYFQDKAGEQRYLVATNTQSYFVYADPKEVENAQNALAQLSAILEIDSEENEVVLTRLNNKESSYALIKKNLTEDEINRINELNLPGIYIQSESMRIYPAGETGAHILGFLGFEGDTRTGQYGIEEYYNNILSGSENYKLFSGQGADSADLELTVDYGIQFVIEKKLEELLDKLDADSATAIFMNPKTGAILAMAQKPGFDSNKYEEVEYVDVFKNNLVQSVYELGSVFKPITMAAAIDAGVVTPQTVYNDTGSIRIGGYTISNFDGKARDLQTMTEVLEKSLNTGAIFAQQQLGKKKFRDYLEAFQFDKLTGIDIQGEVAGNIQSIKNTNRDIDFATASFGQGISFSPLRFLTSAAAIANEGKIMKPFLVNKVIRNEEEKTTEPEVLAQPITALTASRVTAMMVSVADNSFDKKMAVPGYSVAGKTGTAQIPSKDGSGYSDQTIHSVVGFAPAYDPKFVGIIRVDNVRGINFASDSIAPVFGDMASFILQYYQVPPQ